MSQFFTCPYLGSDVELTDEREQHITATHPGTIPNYLEQMRETIEDPDQIRRSERDEKALLFSKSPHFALPSYRLMNRHETTRRHPRSIRLMVRRLA